MRDEIAGRGKLKIFFGYAKGVGKTYAMLKEGCAAREAGADVVLGAVSPHTRPGTMALAASLPGLPLPDYGNRDEGVAAGEGDFNLDAALKRKPGLLLIDELAHTNREGCRHLRRYQDVEEILKAGIDVYTTLDVQNIESMSDIMTALGTQVTERIPDRVFDLADQVKLLDIEPEELIARLRRGQIFGGGRLEKALGDLYTREKLTAFRELFLRRAADRLNRSARSEKGEKSIKTGEHILICLSGSPSNPRVIRAAARMSEAFHGYLTALYVESSGQTTVGEDERRLKANLKLAEDLGAHIATVYGDDVPAQIAEYAKASKVTRIVVGRSNNKKDLLLPRKNLIDKLTQQAPDLDIYIIPDNQTPFVRNREKKLPRILFSWVDFIKALGMVALSSALGLFFFNQGFSEANIITVYILGVLFVSIITNGRIYGAFVSLISVVVFNFLFTEPRFTLLAYDASYPVTFLVMFIASFITSSLMLRVKSQARQAAQKAYRTEVLLETNQKLQKAETFDGIMEETAKQMIKLLNCTVLLYPADEKGDLMKPRIFISENSGDVSAYLGEDEKAVAVWVFRNNKYAGATTSTLPGAKCLYFAVRGQKGVFAVAGIAVHESGGIDSFERDLLVAMLGECGLALEKITLGNAKQQAELQARQEQLRANLLRTISHDLRTPLTSISGNAGILMSNSSVLTEEKKLRLYTDIYDDSMWLINLVENLLSVTRIENGTLGIEMQPELLDEIFKEALRHLNRKAGEHAITTTLSDEFLIARMDARLILQVIINIVDNAIKYTPPGSHIDLSARRQGAKVLVEIADDGPGVPNEAKERLFEMFYTAGKRSGDGRRGMGLGLALCKSIISEHGGTIGVRDNSPRGAVFYFTLQVAEVKGIE